MSFVNILGLALKSLSLHTHLLAYRVHVLVYTYSEVNETKKITAKTKRKINVAFDFSSIYT